MATEIVMPRLSDTMDRGTIARWNKQSGDRVKRGDVLLEIETDKANMELESYAEGILARIMVPEGGTAEVGAPIGVVVADDEELKRLEDSTPPDGEPKTAPDGPPGPRQAPATSMLESNGAAREPETSGNSRLKASPLAKRVAQDRGVDLAQVSGTGPGGRITRQDVEQFIAAGPEPASRPTAETSRGSGAHDEQIQISRMQQTVASRLTQSKVSAPHFYVTTEVDMTHAVRFRLQINEAEPDLKVSFNDLIVKGCGVVLERFPNVNASWQDGAIVRHGRVNVGIAVDLPDGLIVPVLKDVNLKGLRQIAQEAHGLVERSREGKGRPEDFDGGTFTVSNLGMYGVDQFTAIINPPESAILAVGAIVEKPVVVDGEIAIRSRMRVTLSSDHRVIYGAAAAQFLTELRRVLEHPVLLLL